MKIKVDPAALESMAAAMKIAAGEVRSVPSSLGGDTRAAANSVADAGLAAAIEAFSGNVNGGVDVLGQAVDQLSQALRMAADGYRATDQAVIPAEGGGP